METHHTRLVYARVQANASTPEVVKDEKVAQSSHAPFVFKRKRDSATIVADILSSLVGNPRGKRKTNIRQSANLSTFLLKKYLDPLLRDGFVKVEDNGIYRPTVKGIKLLQNLDAQYLQIT